MIRKKPLTKEAALLRMADLCARGEHCSSEIREKLRKLAVSQSDTNDIINYLEENRYIDNLRFAKAFSRDKVRFSGWGRSKIRMALTLKRIAHTDIQEALEEIDSEEYTAVATRVAQVKARNLNINDYADKAKLYRHLASRGFESNIISKIITTLTNPTKD